MQERIFVSYSTNDAPLANKVVEYLESNGRRCWIAPRDIASGLDYSDVITNALKECSVVVLVFSRHSAASQFVKKEITLAVSFNKRILPLRISQVDISGGWHFLLNNVQWIEATSSPEKQFPHLLAGLNQEVIAPPPPPPSPKSWVKWALIGGGAGVALLVTLLLTTRKPAPPEEADSIVLDTTPTAVVPIIPAADSTTVADTVQKGESKKPTKNETTKTGTKQGTTGSTTEPSEPQESKTEPEAGQDVLKENLAEANRLFNRGEYSKAKDLLDSLRQEYPSDKRITWMIEQCKKKLQQQKNTTSN